MTEDTRSSPARPSSSSRAMGRTASTSELALMVPSLRLLYAIGRRLLEDKGSKRVQSVSVFFLQRKFRGNFDG